MSKSNLIEPRKLKGFRDLPPTLSTARESLLSVVRKHAALAGFEPISTPAIEYSEVLLGQGGEETDKEVYRFEDHGERSVALRFDLTVPFARYVAENQGQLVFPLKKLQVGNVWRGEKPQKGRYREFMQCDLDIVGVNCPEADLEILLCLSHVLSELNFGTFVMSVGNRKILSQLIRSLLPKTEDEGRVLIALDKLVKIGSDKVLALLCQIPGVEETGAKTLLQVLESRDNQGDSDWSVVQPHLSDEESQAELVRFQQLVRSLRELSQAKVSADISIARGLGYYTGMVFETTIESLPKFGSICSGGRYDGLVSRFTKRELPGVGGSIGVDRLLAALEELNKLPTNEGKRVLVAMVSSEVRDYAFATAHRLREAGYVAEVGLQRKIANQYKYADRKDCQFVVAVGPDELASGTVGIKNLQTGDEKKNIPQSEILQHL